MTHEPILLSGFADEAAIDKTIDQQFSAMAALGLQHFSIRFIDVGKGIQNVLELDEEGFETVRNRLEDYGLRVATIGSPIGKVKITDVDDGTNNRFVPFAEYLENDVAKACRAATNLDCKLIRGFSFYHPRDSDFQQHLPQAIDQLGQIAERCDADGLTFGLEVEANLIGHRGEILKEIYEAVNHPAMVLIFDGGNLVSQGFSAPEILEQFKMMVGGLGWLHVKDYLSGEGTKAGEYVDEESLDRFVPADQGSTDHLAIFRELVNHLPAIQERLRARDVPGFVVDLEPHLKGGGQFGGFSGPDGMGIALRSLIQLLGQAGIEYYQKQFADLADQGQA